MQELVLPDTKGDFSTAVDAAYATLVRAATVLCASKSDVDDVVQETILHAYKSYPSFRGDSSFLTWAYTILTRVAAAANRERARLVPEEYARSRAGELGPVDAAVMLAEEHRAVIDAVRTLPERQREIVTLRFIEGLSYGGIAETLGVTVGTVKAALFQARMSLKAALAARGIPGEVGNAMP